MNNMNKLQKLIDLCSCGVYVQVDEHKDYYQSVWQFLEDRGAIDDTPPELLNSMMLNDTIVCVTFYPDTPVGFYTVYNYDLDKALDVALNILEENRHD